MRVMERRRVLGVQRDVGQLVSSSGMNSKYTVGADIMILLDEVLNNSTRAVLVFGDFSSNFSDFEMYQLAKVIQYNHSLVAVTISSVDIGDDLIGVFCQALMRSNIQYLDFTNTPIDDDAGTSLAALAQCNPNLRTVIVTNTLISDDIMDEIDAACLNNETNFDVPCPPPILPNRTRYCVAHIFHSCPNGQYCLLSHAPPGASERRDLNALDWDCALENHRLTAGATWRTDDEFSKPLTIDLQRSRIRISRVANRGSEQKYVERKIGIAVGTLSFVAIVSLLWVKYFRSK